MLNHSSTRRERVEGTHSVVCIVATGETTVPVAAQSLDSTSLLHPMKFPSQQRYQNAVGRAVVDTITQTSADDVLVYVLKQRCTIAPLRVELD